MRTYVMSDIHGCFDIFLQMLERIEFGNADRLILAGDYVDRGTQNLQMLRWLEDCPGNVVALRGNHDEEFAANVSLMAEVDRKAELQTDGGSNEEAKALYDSVKYALQKTNPEAAVFFDYYGGIRQMLEQKATMRELMQWSQMIQSMPYYYKTEIHGRTCIIVHAGYIEDLQPVSDRYQTRQEFFLHARQDAYEFGGVAQGIVIAGHTPTIAAGNFSCNDGKVFRYYDDEKDCIFYNIDCGCVMRDRFHNGKLACIRMEDEKVFYI